MPKNQGAPQIDDLEEDSYMMMESYIEHPSIQEMYEARMEAVLKANESRNIMF